MRSCVWAPRALHIDIDDLVHVLPTDCHLGRLQENQVGLLLEAKMFEARFMVFGCGCLCWSIVWDYCFPEARHAGGFEYISIYIYIYNPG